MRDGLGKTIAYSVKENRVLIIIFIIIIIFRSKQILFQAVGKKYPNHPCWLELSSPRPYPLDEGRTLLLTRWLI